MSSSFKTLPPKWSEKRTFFSFHFTFFHTETDRTGHVVKNVPPASEVATRNDIISSTGMSRNLQNENKKLMFFSWRGAESTEDFLSQTDKQVAHGTKSKWASNRATCCQLLLQVSTFDDVEMRDEPRDHSSSQSRVIKSNNKQTAVASATSSSKYLNQIATWKKFHYFLSMCF